MSISAEALPGLTMEFGLVTRALAEPHLLVAPGGEIAAANPAAERMLGLPGGASGTNLRALIGEPPEHLASYLRACAASGSLLPGALSLPDAEGATRRFRCDGAAARVRGPGGEPLVLLRFRSHEQASHRFHVLNRKIAELASENQRRRWAEGRLRVLAEAGRLLTASLDPEAALQGLAELCTATIADYCVTYLHEGGSVRRVGLSHADPARAPLVEQLLHQRPPDLLAAYGAGAVIRTGEPVLAESISDELLEAAAEGDTRYGDLLRELRPRSSILVPLRAGDTIHGAIAVATVEGGRAVYTREDLQVLQQLAGRAALLVGGARSHAELADAHEILRQQAAELEMQAEELQSQAAVMEEAQAELELANRELQRSNRGLTEQSRIAREALAEAQRARAEAEEANRAKAQFLATMSHELRTPLNAIGGYVDLIELGIHGPVTDAQRQGLERVRRNQRHLLTLINDILNFARLEAGQVEFRFGAVALKALLSNLETLIEPQLQAKSLAYSCGECPASLAAWGDEERIHQVLINLLTNATKFTPPGGRIVLDCAAEPERVSIRVHDDGPGIPADRLGSIFDPFVQVNRQATAEAQQGVGLGLAISRDLARRMEGDLMVESVEGEGSVFTLTLPRALDVGA